MQGSRPLENLASLIKYYLASQHHLQMFLLQKNAISPILVRVHGSGLHDPLSLKSQTIVLKMVTLLYAKKSPARTACA